MLLLSSAIARAADEPASFARDVQPILKRSCAGCHRPEKLKGKLDLTTFAALAHGGKHGPIFVAGEPDKSPLVQQVSGDDPDMPNKGEKLSPAEVDVLRRWVLQGAKDDSPAGGVAASDPAKTMAPETYALAPVISAMALSPDGKVLAVAGWHEVLLVNADGSGLIARMPGSSPHLNSLCFYADGAKLMSAGGSAAEYGRIDLYNIADHTLEKTIPVSSDTLFGLSISPTGDRAAVGCADKTTRVIAIPDGTEIDRFTQATDWALCTAFNVAGDRLVSGSRDKSVWLLDLPSHRPFDLVNYPTDPILCLARKPGEDIIASGASTGAMMLHRLRDLVKTTEANRDPNRIKEMEHMNGPVNAIIYSPDGKLLAAASTGEVRVYTSDGNRRLCTCSGHQGGVFAIAFSPDGKQIYTGGFDGKVRIFGTEKGNLVKTFVPFPTVARASSP
ncbi:MAG TPA: c-type cytochrome domain-containing protein [Tepidisphaeraceae bacterium]|nr:c-type cytochrome domain-containing protein [Tepidisphaeraceae bacterium]